jgi:hypothetical protein
LAGHIDLRAQTEVASLGGPLDKWH